MVGKVMCSQGFGPLQEEESHWIFENKGHLLQLFRHDKSVSIGLGVCQRLINKPCSTSISQAEYSHPSPPLLPLSNHHENRPSCLGACCCHHHHPHPVILGPIAPQSQVPLSSQQKLKLPHQGPCPMFFPLVCQIALRLLWLKYLGCVQSIVFGLQHQGTVKKFTEVCKHCVVIWSIVSCNAEDLQWR